MKTTQNFKNTKSQHDKKLTTPIIKVTRIKIIFFTFKFTLFMALGGCSEVNFAPTNETVQKSVVKNPPPNNIETYEEKFNQVAENAKLDILVIVDNSPSMSDEQQKMGQRIASFTSYLNNIDWQIGVTTTDTSNGKYGIQGSLLKNSLGNSFIRSTDFDYEQLFLDLVVRPESRCFLSCPSSRETPLLATLEAIQKKDTDNVGFFRGDADLVLFYITDEDESDSLTASDTLSSIRSLWPEKTLRSYGIVVQPGDNHCLGIQAPTSGREAPIVSDFIQQTGGITGSICDSDYGSILSNIGSHVKKLYNRVELSQTPKPNSVVVRLVPTQNIPFHVEGRRILFDTPPQEGTQIFVSYEKAE